MFNFALRLLVMASIAVAPAQAASCRASSGSAMRPLVELYTSEGCDSCPPADRWLSSRFSADGSSAPAIAVAFHVDYWDRLGWADRFATHAYTERQYEAMRANGGSFVYTPQVLLQGRSFEGWQTDPATPLDRAARSRPGATLALVATPHDREMRVEADVEVADAGLAKDSRVFVAYVDSGLVSDVKAGENRGLRMTHDHVVRTLRVAGTPAADRRLRATLTLPVPREAGSHPQLVAFVQRASTGDVLQALELPLDACPSP